MMSAKMASAALCLAVLTVILFSRARVTYADNAMCQMPQVLAAEGLMATSAQSWDAVPGPPCGDGADDGMVAAGTADAHPATPPPLPLSGAGDLHLVTQGLTKAVTETSVGDAIDLGSGTITVNQDTTGYSLEVAFALASVDGISVADCGQAVAGGQPWQVHYPAALGGGLMDYPSGAVFLQELADAGYLDTSAIDVSTARDASWPTDVWTEQPTFGAALGSDSPAALAHTLVPGILYVNLQLAANPGDPRWRVAEWNYAFAVHAELAGVCPTQPQPQPGPPPALCPAGTGTAGGGPAASGGCSPQVLCPDGLTAQPDGSCGSKPGNTDQPACLGGARVGEVPPLGVDVTQWCDASPRDRTPAPCAPAGCPAVLTCGGGLACSLLPPPHP
jgi:hypothetical protein